MLRILIRSYLLLLSFRKSWKIKEWAENGLSVRCKGKTLPPIIWIFTEGESDGILNLFYFKKFIFYEEILSYRSQCLLCLVGSKEYHVHDSKDSSNRGLRPQAQPLQLQTLLRELRKAEKKLKCFFLIDTRGKDIKVDCTLIYKDHFRNNQKWTEHSILP